jgi:hypothetical protein
MRFLSAICIMLYVLLQCIVSTRNWDRAVGIATGYELNDGGVGIQVPVRSRIYVCFLHMFYVLLQCTNSIRSLDSSVDIATGCELNDGGVGFQVPVGSRVVPSPSRPDRLWGLPSLISNGFRGAISPRVKRPGRESNYSPPNSVEVKEIWISISTPPYAFMA